jgi:hypothetical protein
MRTNLLILKELLIDTSSKLLNVVRIPSLYYLLNFYGFNIEYIKSFSISFSLLMLISSAISLGFFDQLSRKAVLSPINARLNIFKKSSGALFYSVIFSLFCVFLFLLIFKNHDFALFFVTVSFLIFFKNSVSIFLRANARFFGVLFVSLLDLVCALAFGFLAYYFNDVNILILGTGISAIFIVLYVIFRNGKFYHEIFFHIRLDNLKFMFLDFLLKFKYAVPSLMYISMFWGISFALKNVHAAYLTLNLFYIIDVCFTAVFPSIAFLVSFANIKSIFTADGYSKKKILNYVVAASSIASIFLHYFDLDILIYLLALLIVIFSVELFGISWFSLLYLSFLMMAIIIFRDLEFLLYYFLLSTFFVFFVVRRDMLRDLFVVNE